MVIIHQSQKVIFIFDYMNRSLFLDNPNKFVIRYQEPSSKQQKPLNISSEQVLPKVARRRNRLLYSQINHMRKIVSKQPVSYSAHTNIDDKKDEREYSRVPIEYMDERDNGNIADKIRGRVVYRGYTPKNTYYYFKTIKDIKYAASGKEGDYRGQDLVFNSKFQSGNLNAAVRISNREYWLFMREDTNTHGLRQWYFFEVRSRKCGTIKFRIYRFNKRFSLYKQGMRPFVRTATTQWKQSGEKVSYEWDSQIKCYYLQFQYEFEEHKEVYFAALPPYTYSKLNEWLDQISINEKVHKRKIGLSLGGLDLHCVVINDRKKKKKDKEDNDDNIGISNLSHGEGEGKHKNKEAIIILARTHPGQTVSNWSLESFVSKVLETPQLMDNYVFFIVPMVNPDGVFIGNHRTGVIGQDLNRNFHRKDLQFFPQIQAVEKLVHQVHKKYHLAFLFDLHGHSAKKNIFAFGQQCEIGSDRYLYGRIIPKMLSDQVSSFRYDFCLFKATKEKTNTARVYFSNKYGANAITFEQSYGLLDAGAIGIHIWMNFGMALADVLAKYLNFGTQRRVDKIRQYLQVVTYQEEEAIRMKKEKQLQKQNRKRQKEKQLQKEAEKQISYPSKTEGSYEEPVKESPSYSLTDAMLRKMKIKTPRNLTNIEEESEPIRSLTQQKELDDQEELSSGEEDLQLKDNELELIKKDIVKIGVMNHESTKRELYSMAQQKMELSHQFSDYTSRLHHKQNPAAQRIFKFKSRQKVRESEHSQNSNYFRGGSSIELPSIKKSP